MSEFTDSAEGGAISAESPNPRRTASSTLRAGGALAPSGAAPAKAEAPDEDAELLALLPEWIVAEREYTRLYSLLDNAASGLPRRPAELMRRRADVEFWGANDGLPDGDLPYYTRDWVEAYGRMLHSRLATYFLRYGFTDALDRFEEIRRSIADWEAATERARVAAGLAELESASAAACVKVLERRRRVVLTPARTLAGLIAKLATAGAASGAESLENDLADLARTEATTLEEDLASLTPDQDDFAAGGGAPTIDSVFLSSALDALRLAESDPALAGVAALSEES